MCGEESEDCKQGDSFVIEAQQVQTPKGSFTHTDSLKAIVHKASPVYRKEEPVPNGEIVVNRALPERSTPISHDDMLEMYKQDAENIFTVLSRTLPQATMTQLLIKMLRAQRDIYMGKQ